MMPFMTQPAVAPACYVPRERDTASQMFRGGYLSRTPTVTADRTRWAMAFSVQRTALAAALAAGRAFIFGTALGADNRYTQVVSINDQLLVSHSYQDDAWALWTSRLFRDPSAFNHVVIAYDSNQGVAGDRVKIWINGERITAFSSASYPGLGAETHVGHTLAHFVGRYQGSEVYPLHALMSDFMLVTGAALPASAFGEANIHGVWVPRPAAEIHAAIVAAGGWGVNGCHLDFGAPLNPGKDVSGKGNHWTAVGFDATGKDTVSSTPTNVYATWSALTSSPSASLPYGVNLSDGALILEGQSTYNGYVYAEATMRLPTGRHTYLEVDLLSATDSAAEVGVGGLNISLVGSPHLTWAVGDTVGVLVTDTAIYARRQGIWVVGNPITGVGGVPRTSNVIWASDSNGIAGSTCRIRANFGQRAWRDTPPAGAGGLCTDNLPEPEIKDPGEAFAQVVTTGANMEGALNALTGHWDSAPYMEIVKRRDASEDWRVRLSDDPTNAWATNNANAKTAAPALASAGNYVGYRMRVGARYGVWTAEVDHVNGTATTVSHGLNTARAVVIATRVSAGGGDRFVWHPDLPNGQLLKLNSIAGAAADSSLGAFGVNSFQLAAALPSGTYRVLVLAERVGFLSLSKHIGNGILNGPMVPMDILPLFSITKRCTNIPSNANGWQVHDAARDSGNGLVTRLWVNIPDSDHPTVAQVDFVVGGLKWRDYAIDVNASGETFINIAIGRPIGGVCVAPATAR